MFNWFKKPVPTNYPAPVLSPLQLQLLDALDSHLVEYAPGYGGHLDVRCVDLTMSQQAKGFDACLKLLKQATVQSGPKNYIPRTIALVTDQDGTWNFLIGYRNPRDQGEPVKNLLFLQALGLTNQARVTPVTKE